MPEDQDWIERLNELEDTVGGEGDSSLVNVVERVLLLPLIAFFLQLANALEAILDVFIVPTNELIDGSTQFLTATFDGVENIIQSGAEASAGGVEGFGLVGFPLAQAVVLLGGAVIALFLLLGPTGDTAPFTFTDIPFVGTEEEDE